MNLNDTLDLHHKKFPYWLNDQPDTAVWEAMSPYTCPVAMYFKAHYPGTHISVWKDCIWLGKDDILFNPGHRFRRLITITMLLNKEFVSKQDIIERVKRIWRTEWYDPEAKFDVEQFRRERREANAKHRLEWGW